MIPSLCWVVLASAFLLSCSSKKKKEPYRKDVFYKPPSFVIHSEEVNDDGVVEIIEPSPWNLPATWK